MLLALAGAVARGRGVLRVAGHHLIFLHLFSTTVDFEHGDTSLVLL